MFINSTLGGIIKTEKKMALKFHRGSYGNIVTLFSLEQNIFFLEHKLLPVHLTWLHLVYGKILFQARHPHLMVYEENYTI